MLRKALYVGTALGAVHLGLLAFGINLPVDELGFNQSQLDLLYIVFGALGVLDILETIGESDSIPGMD